MPTETYTIADLAGLTGLNVRTIRYYLAQGLLPASGESGPGAHYGEGHLDRLRLTKRLQQQHLPLAEIRRRLAELTDGEVSAIASTDIPPTQEPATSALDYIRSVLGSSPAAAPTARLMASAVPAPSAPTATASAGALLHGRALDAPKFIVSEPSAIDAQAPIVPADIQPMRLPRPIVESTPEPPGPERSQWDRLELSPNIELHVRRPLSRLEQRRVERLITIARQVLKEDMK